MFVSSYGLGITSGDNGRLTAHKDQPEQRAARRRGKLPTKREDLLSDRTGSLA